MKKPEVYLDMDGVLADFFTEYAKLAGIESGNYRDIPPAKTDPTLQKMVGTDFFARLPKLRNADQLVAMIVKLYGHYHICSSPLRGDYENSEAQKKVWIQKHLNPQPNDIVITPNKAKWAKQVDGTPNILIDDRGSNISAWEAAGGIGIKYQADEDGLDVIVNGLTRARKIMKGEEEHKPQDLKSVDRSSGKLIAKSGDSDEPSSAADVKESATSMGASISPANPAAGGGANAGWLFGGTVGAPKGAKKKKAKVIKR
jgi:5'-nucleotidase